MNLHTKVGTADPLLAEARRFKGKETRDSKELKVNVWLHDTNSLVRRLHYAADQRLAGVATYRLDFEQHLKGPNARPEDMFPISNMMRKFFPDREEEEEEEEEEEDEEEEDDDDLEDDDEDQDEEQGGKEADDEEDDDYDDGDDWEALLTWKVMLNFQLLQNSSHGLLHWLLYSKIRNHMHRQMLFFWVILL